MKTILTPLGIFGLAYLLFGTIMNFLMYADNMWPTYLFFVAMGIGALFLVLNKVTKRLPNYRVWQTILGLLPLGILFVWMEAWNLVTPTESAELPHVQMADGYQNGDLIFQTSTSRQSEAIQLATNSKYSHMGILFEKDGQFFVYEAVQPVKLTPVAEWINQGKNRHYVLKRLKNAHQILTTGAVENMKKIGEQFKGKPYDSYFEWSDDRIYCSELVWKIYEQATGIQIGKLQQLADFDLTHPLVQTTMKERYGDKIPLNEKVISPAAMFNSDLLITVEKK